MKIVVEIFLFLSLLLTVFSYIFYRAEKKLKGEEQGEKSITERINIYLGRRKEGEENYSIFSYAGIEKYLKRTGNAYNLNPVSYVILKITISIACFMFFQLFWTSIPIIFAIIAGILGFFTLDISIVRRDKKETKIIMFEFKDVYESLILQTAGGAYISNALAECYTVVSNKRLKKSLALMSAVIWKTSSIQKALVDFSERFKSDEVNNFVLIINQSLQTGKIKEQLSDQSETMSELSVINLKESTLKIDEDVDFITFLIFLGIFAIIFYYCILLIKNNGTSMFQ